MLVCAACNNGGDLPLEQVNECPIYIHTHAHTYVCTLVSSSDQAKAVWSVASGLLANSFDENYANNVE